MRKIIVGKKNKHPKNIICNKKYSWYSFIFLVLYSQFKRAFNIYFLAITFTQFFRRYRVTSLITCIGPLIFVIFVTFLKEGYDDYKRYVRDKIANSEEFYRLNDKKRVPSSNLCVGDLIVLRKGQRVPADLVLLKSDSGQCFIKTDQLDGETDWKLRIAAPVTQNLDQENIVKSKIVISVDEPHKDIYSFLGKLTIETDDRILNQPLDLENMLWMNTKVANEECIGCVVYTGSETRAMMNTSKPRDKVGMLEYEIDKYTFVLFGMSFIVSLFFSYLGNGFNNRFDMILIRFMVIFSAVIPISLRVTIDCARIYFYSKQLADDKEISGCIVRSSTMHEELGRISYFLTDKTGTLTKNEMEMKKIHLGTIGYTDELNGEVANIFCKTIKRKKMKKKDLGSRVYDLVQGLSVCHNASPISNSTQNLDMSANESKISESVESEQMIQSSSPDEIAILNWTGIIGMKLYKRDTNYIINKDVLGREHKYTILYNFPFTSERKRMGIIVKKDETNEIIFYLKGADVVMKKIVKVNDWLEEEVDNMARDGLRTLVIAKKDLTDEQLQEFSKKYTDAQLKIENRNEEVQKVVEELEVDMDILGLTGVEDKLQDNVRGTLDTLKNAGMKIWMLTGDKIETAISIARSSRLFEKNDVYMVIKEVSNEKDTLNYLKKIKNKQVECLVIDGKSIESFLNNFFKEFIIECSKLKAIVCCRCTPTQKAILAKYLAEFTKKRVCCIGDGGNDVSMITEANVGIGIVGKEGNQASLAADFSILRFQDVTSLFLWHGRNWYIGTTNLINFIIHRGTVISVIQGMFSSIFLFSPIAIFQGKITIAYVTIYTILPIFSILSYVQVPKTYTEKYPELYKDLVKEKRLSFRNFLSWNLVSFYQGSVIIIFSLYLFEKELFSIITISFSCLVINELLMVYFTTYKYTRTMLYAQIISLIIFFLSFIIFSDELKIQSSIISFIGRVSLINFLAILISIIQILWSFLLSPPSHTKIY